MFDLEKSIKNWKRSLRKNSGYEDGDIEELESHLRDLVDSIENDGHSKQQAFEMASSEIGDIESLGVELYKTRISGNHSTPHWEQSSDILSLLPNYVKVAWRNLTLKKGYSIINITGLSVGLAACLLITLYVQYEWSYDTFHKEADRSYRVLREFDLPDLQTTISGTPSALAPATTKNLASVERAIRIQMNSPVVGFASKKFVEPSFLIADEGFFEIFSFQLLEGASHLDRPNTLMITERMVPKYFGEEDPIGKSLLIGSQEMEVTGVLANPPSNSHLDFDFLASMNDPEPNWGRNNYQSYLLLRPNQSIDVVTKEIADLIRSQSGTDDQSANNSFIPHLQPITGVYLGQGVSADISSEGNILYLYLFIALAFSIILLACINFMNLATARSMERAREVGMRKTLGGNRTQLAFQFLGESLLMTFLGSLLGIALNWVALPFLNDIAGTSIQFVNFFTLKNLALLTGVTLLTGILAGGYPAFVLSRFQPSQVLKSVFNPEGNTLFRKSLVVFQFTTSIALLAGTGIIHKQIQYMKSSGLGFNPDNVVLIKQANFLGRSHDSFTDELLSISGVENVSSGFSVPGTFFINSMWQPDTPDADAHNLDYSFVNFGYVETLNLEIIAGRSISSSFESDSFAVMLNEAAIKDFGWSPDEAIEHKILRGTTEYSVIGVLKDFNYRSLHSEVYPLALFGPLRRSRYIALRVNPEANIPQIIEEAEIRWKQFSSLALEYSFLADDLKSQYEAEDRLIKVFGSFASLAIFIGCLGLFGLAAFMILQRTKEIGIRKVLGATTTQIVRLVSIDLLKLVAIAFLIAIPLTWIMMNQWLRDFAYKSDIDWLIFLVTGLLILAIALVTVSGQAIRAALANPVHSLKSE